MKLISQTIVAWFLFMFVLFSIDSGDCISLAMGGMVVGLMFSSVWMIGCIYGLAIFQAGNPPKWMTWFANDPPGSRFHWLRQPKTLKIISVCFLAIVLLPFVYTVINEESNADISFVVGALASFIIGVTLVESYFRRNYTKVRR